MAATKEWIAKVAILFLTCAVIIFMLLYSHLSWLYTWKLERSKVGNSSLTFFESTTKQTIEVRIGGNYSVIFSEDMTPERNETRGKEKFLSFSGCKPLELSCSTCAYVIGSGHLSGSKLGKEIDSHQCVVRPNDVPVTGYEEDVGRKTTIRTVDATSMEIILRKSQSGQLLDSTFPNNIFVFSPVLDPRLEKTVNKSLSRYPRMEIFVHSPTQARYAETVFNKEIGKSTKTTMMSNGLFTLLFLREYCGIINVYGISPPHYCYDAGHKDVKYHYYGKWGSECAIFTRRNLWHEFVKEKKLFEKWKLEWKNLKFYCPEWPKKLK